MEQDHYGLNDVKNQVLEFLAVRQLRQRAPQQAAQGNDDDKEAKGPILLFVGPPGVGKTSIAKSIARAMGRPYVRISLGGARDEADIRGHRRTYVGAMPGRIIQGMKQAGAKNPVFLLDEVDKLGVSFQGDPAAALLEVLDPAQNDSFTDHYLGVPFDLSEVLFIATANFPQSIPGPLLDRLETVNFAGYTEREKLEIARRYLVPRQLRDNGLSPEQLEITDAGLSEITTSYTREAGVRQLEREIGKLGRKVARKIADGGAERIRVDAGDVDDLIGRPKVHPEHKAREDQVGVATGMYYTPVGGERDAGQGRARADRPAGRRHEGVGAGGPDVRQVARRPARNPRGGVRRHRHPRPRPGGRHPEGRTLGGRHHGDGAGLRAVAPVGAPRPGHDG